MANIQLMRFELRELTAIEPDAVTLETASQMQIRW
jgi:hypothetical protein